MMKRLLAMLLAVLMVLSLAGCGQGLEAPNGKVLKESEDHGIATFSYAGTTVPVGLGLPKLTNKEIDDLIAKADYAATAQAITTVADAVNYIRRSEIDYVAPPTLLVEHGMQYSYSAWQVLKDNIGECWSMSNLLRYLLKEDYEEVGYINAWTPVDGHVMGYIYHEGLYYLTNPVGYCTDGAWESGWISDYPAKMIVCADDFQIIADSLTEYMSFGSGELVNCVHRINAPGDFACGYRKDTWLYPVGTEVIRYYGEDYIYQETSVDWQSQTRINSEIVEEEDLVSIEIQEKIDELLIEGDYERICAEIVTAEEVTQLIVASGIEIGEGTTIEAAFAEKKLWPDKIVELACHILEGDYEELGMVTMLADNYYFLYVKNEDNFLLCDVLGYSGGIVSDPFESKDAMVEYAIAERGDSDATISTWPW